MTKLADELTALAMSIACEAVRNYGEGSAIEREAAQGGNLWNDHPAYQAALAALTERSEHGRVHSDGSRSGGQPVGTNARSDGWRDIATWPRTDESHALVCKAGQMFPVIACYDVNSDSWVSFNGYYERTNGRLVPTHWQPLPTPPETTP